MVGSVTVGQNHFSSSILTTECHPVAKVDIFYESKSGFRQDMPAINLGRHNRQIKDVRIEHLVSDCIAMSGWTFSQIQNKIFLKLYL